MSQSTYIELLPEVLRLSAYRADDEAAWPRESAAAVIDCLSALGIVVAGIEIWLPTRPGPTIPTPFIYTWEVDDRYRSETWDEYVTRCNNGAREYVRSFEWDERDLTHRGLDPYFNLDTVARHDCLSCWGS